MFTSSHSLPHSLSNVFLCRRCSLYSPLTHGYLLLFNSPMFSLCVHRPMLPPHTPRHGPLQRLPHLSSSPGRGREDGEEMGSRDPKLLQVVTGAQHSSRQPLKASWATAGKGNIQPLVGTRSEAVQVVFVVIRIDFSIS